MEGWCPWVIATVAPTTLAVRPREIIYVWKENYKRTETKYRGEVVDRQMKVPPWICNNFLQIIKTLTFTEI